MPDIFDELDIFDQVESEKPKLTGDPTIDMAGPNKELAVTQREAASPFMTAIKKAPSLTAPVQIAQNVIDIAKGANYALTNPSQVLSAIPTALSRPDKIFSEYIGRYSPENIRHTLINDPLGVIMDATVVGGIGRIGLRAAKKAIPVTTPEQMVAKAEGITQKILNPSKDVIVESLLRNSKIPAVRELAKVIKKAPTEKALLSSTDDAIKTIFNERDSIIKSNNFRMTDNHIKDLESFIQQRKSSGQINPSELRQMENVLAEEKAWYVKNANKFDRASGQSRKEYLQDITNSLLEKRIDGTKAVTQPARKQALDILRNGLKIGVEGNDPRIRSLNSTYAGLKDAREMLASQAAIVEQNANKGIVERLVLLTQSAVNPQAAATNIALKNARNIQKLSGKAEKLMAKATKNNVKRVIDEAISTENRKILGLPDLTPKYLKERVGFREEFGTTRAKGTSTRGVPTEDIIRKEGYVPPQLPAPKPKYLQEREKLPIESLGVKGQQRTALGSKETIPVRGASKRSTIDIEKKGASTKEILDESYKLAIEAKLKRMMNR
jgi:hypothetical protein